ncbi:MAG: preprotein translocase subunit SecA [Nitrospirota bacterium]|nr:preprotein translocase subunit SecA [Nitrospirota bacterium]
MFAAILSKLIGTKNERELRPVWDRVARINTLEPDMRALSDAEMANLTARFRARLAAGETLDELLPEAFAAVREAARRTLGLRHYDVQLVGGMVLHQGRIAEMKTGEGKTLVATLATYLNALPGRGTHVITVNDYLARRDSDWMGAVYRFLGMSVGVIVAGLSDAQRKEAYNSDITYGTNNEFGFDYLRDNMKLSLESYCQRDLYFAIVDEVDSILIDEARTPLIISGPAEHSTSRYYDANRVIPFLEAETDYTLDEKAKSAYLSEEGIRKVEKQLEVDNLYDLVNIGLLHAVQQALKAHKILHRDVDYVVRNGQVAIVDEFTGRVMEGRRWSDGLHQAVEAKEGVTIENENQTLASITFQNYFRMYEKLAGMTGTAETEAPEFAKIYNLDVVVIPPNQPVQRRDYADLVYKTEAEKYEAIADEIRDCHQRGQPVLVGTVTIEKSEKLSRLLKQRGIKHNVLNAKFHEKEAEIVAQAGRAGAVTIATNMAGRGTDIVLGGNPDFLLKRRRETNPDMDEAEVAALRQEFTAHCVDERQLVLREGGLHIIGTERHESRRIDNQLRGRSGRQGDPGSSRFYLGLDDPLMRIFGSDRVASIMERLGMEDGVPIEHRMVSRAIEGAQKKVEMHHFDMRKHLLEYDDVMNQQRSVIYRQRRMILAGEDLKETIEDYIRNAVAEVLNAHCPEERYQEEWDITGLKEAVGAQFNLSVGATGIRFQDAGRDAIAERLQEAVLGEYHRRSGQWGETIARQVEKLIMLRNVDVMWKDHLLAMDHLKEGIGLRGYGQKNPLTEYKREGFDFFEQMMLRIEHDVVDQLFRVQVSVEPHEEPPSLSDAIAAATGGSGRVTYSHQEVAPVGVAAAAAAQPRPQQPQAARSAEAQRMEPVRADVKVGRNDPCPCGSGKKYKKCHGTEA